VQLTTSEPPIKALKSNPLATAWPIVGKLFTDTLRDGRVQRATAVRGWTERVKCGEPAKTDAVTRRLDRALHSHLFRSKKRTIPIATASINTRAQGYPKRHPSSGMLKGLAE